MLFHIELRNDRQLSNWSRLASPQVCKTESEAMQSLITIPGSRCGSIFINLEFKKWLRMLLGEEEYLKLDPNLDIDKNANHASETPAMRELMQAFDDVKKQFAFSTPDVRFSLRGELENLDIFGKVNKGLITIPQYV